MSQRLRTLKEWWNVESKKCDYRVGCHECIHRLTFLHAQLRQELTIPNGNHERIRAGYVSIKRFIEDIVGVGEAEVRGLESGDGLPSSDCGMEHGEETRVCG
jgi:hypothetical protein